MRKKLVYIALAALILFLLSRQLQQPEQVEPEMLSRPTIMQQFETETEVAVAFPLKYRGVRGDAFYVIQQKSGQTVIDYYEIYNDNDEKLHYRVKDHWENIRLPLSRFDTYKLEQGKWQQLSE